MAKLAGNHNRDAIISVCLFSLSIALYLLLGVHYGSGDTVPASLAALNLLQNGTLYFDDFKDGYLGQGYYFTHSLHGHWVSAYPIGVSILSFPIYLVLYLGLRIFAPSTDITDPSFEPLRIWFESIAAAILTALAVVVFYRASRLKFSPRVALLTTIIFAFATSTWFTSGRALWQHGPANLMLVTGFYLLLQATRQSTPSLLLLRLSLAGVCFGLLPAVRPSSAIFSIAALAYVLYYYRFKALVFIGGFSAYLPVLVWNISQFGQASGGYGRLSGQALYTFTFSHFLTTALAHLVSPSRGLLLISPILLLFIPGLRQLGRSLTEPATDRWLVYTLLLAALGVFIQYSFYTFWWAGYSAGTRFMTDLLVPLVYVINYTVAGFGSGTRGWETLVSKLFWPLVGISLVMQIALVMGTNGWQWDPIPIDSNLYPQRFWHIKDNQVIRCFKSLVVPLRVGETQAPDYLPNLKGTINQVAMVPYGPEINPFRDFENISPEAGFKPGEKIYLRAHLTNRGDKAWFGVHSALLKGESRVRVRLVREGQVKSEDRLFVLADRVLPGQDTVAIGMVKLPEVPGPYQLKFDLVLEVIGYFSPLNGSTHEMNLMIQKGNS